MVPSEVAPAILLYTALKKLKSIKRMQTKIQPPHSNSRLPDKMALILAIGLLLLITAILYRQIKTLEKSSERVSNSIRIDKEINKLFSQFDLMESREFRAEILKDSTLGESFAERKLENDQSLEKLRSLTQGMLGFPAYLNTVGHLKDSLHTILTDLQGTIPDNQLRPITKEYYQSSSLLLERLRNLKFQMLAHNEKLLMERMAKYKRHTFFTPMTSVLLALFSIGVFGIAYLGLRRQKNRIQSSEVLLQNIVQSTDNIMNYYEPIFDPGGNVVDFRVVFANVCNRDYLDLEPGELTGRPVSEVFPFLLENNELGRMIACYLNNETIDFERQVTLKGEQVWFHTFVRPMDHGILEVVRNHTREYKAKENLLKLNERLEIQNLIMTEAKRMANIGSYISSPKTEDVEFSDNIYRILDCRPREFEPSYQAFRKFLHPEDLEDFDGSVPWKMSKGSRGDHLYRIISKKGKVKHLRTKGRKTRINGRTVVIGVVQDISDRIQAENNLRIKNLELNRGIVELESFNRVASHDLQEPLRKIQMFLSRIDETERAKLSEKGRDYLNRTNRVAARMQSLIQNLLAYAQIGSKHDESEEIDLNEVFHKVKEDYSEWIQEAGAKLVFQNLPTVQGVFFQLEQLFGNLVSNALKYRHPEFSPQIEVRSERLPGRQVPGDRVKPANYYHKITVSDNGIGFDNQNADMIFELFQRLHPMDRRSGTGIGLAICKKIVENHHGFIQASGTLGKGSTFVIYLPL